MLSTFSVSAKTLEPRKVFLVPKETFLQALEVDSGYSHVGTGATNLDGFVVGMLNGTVNGDACIIQYEPIPIRFFISDVNVAGPAPERMQLTYGGQMAGGTECSLYPFNLRVGS